MLDIKNIADDELATCVDEYFKRIINLIRENPEFNKDTVSIHVDTSQHYYDGEYTVRHKVQIGDSYGGEGYAQSETSDAVRGARSCINRLMVDRAVPPHKYSAQLPAPEKVDEENFIDSPPAPPPIEPEDAEFEPVDPDLTN